jgi:hypothetical protein
MSEKKSWDIRPNTGRTVRIATGPAIPERTRAPERGPNLKNRRRRARKRFFILIGILIAVVLGASVYLLWRPELRIQNVTIETYDAAALDPLVKGALVGSYFGILPRDSIVFFPKQRIRNAILDAYPVISAVSVSRVSLTSITIKTIERVSAFDWCGTTPDITAPCYESDAEGLVFAPSVVPISLDGATSTPSKTLRIYGPLVEASSSEPIRSHVANASAIPNALRFERGMVSLGADVVSLELRTDEADVHLRSGTRITYVLGHEEQAAELAATAFPEINVNDGSVLYLDLRFDGKVYFKKKGI